MNKPFKDILKALSNNNIVPIIVALIPIIAGNKYLDYRLTQLENNIPSKGNIEQVSSKLDSYILFQDKINNLVLSYISTRPTEGSRLEYPMKGSTRPTSLESEVSFPSKESSVPKKEFSVSSKGSPEVEKESRYSYYVNMAKYLLFESSKKNKNK